VCHVLVLNKLEIEDFGPFKGVQELAFAKPGKVCIVYGENMRGKTTLLNAIRYAIIGQIIGRGFRDESLHETGNWESAEQGKFGFRTTLWFDFDGSSFELTRGCRPRKEVKQPENDTDYEEYIHMVRDGRVLGPEEQKKDLRRVMSPETARFFLFDAELLQQYEELLRDPAKMGRQIREAIERILGVPVLTGARARLRDAERDIQQDRNKTAKKSKETNQLATFQTQNFEMQTQAEKEISTYQGELRRLGEHQQSLRRHLERLDRLGDLSTLQSERDSLKQEMQHLRDDLSHKADNIRQLNADLWLWILEPEIECLRDSLSAETGDWLKHQVRLEVNKELLGRCREGLESRTCSLCKTELSDSATEVLQSQVAELALSTKETNPESPQTEQLVRWRAATSVRVSSQVPFLRALLHDIEDERIALAETEEKQRDLDREISSRDRSDARKARSDLETTQKEIVVLERSLEESQKKLSETEDRLKGIGQKLARIGNPEVGFHTHRLEACKALHDVFNQAVVELRDRLRGEVEKDATKVFLKLTTEPDYGSLQINENYGLQIIHNDGRVIPVRSAGAEHIVALSLIAALQKNSSVSGPIVMDSPFGRLDSGHTDRIMRSLPDLADQVTLLVYKSEIDRDLAIDTLRGRIGHEYEIQRVSARHSILLPLEGNSHE